MRRNEWEAIAFACGLIALVCAIMGVLMKYEEPLGQWGLKILAWGHSIGGLPTVTLILAGIFAALALIVYVCTQYTVINKPTRHEDLLVALVILCSIFGGVLLVVGISLWIGEVGKEFIHTIGEATREIGASKIVTAIALVLLSIAGASLFLLDHRIVRKDESNH